MINIIYLYSFILIFVNLGLYGQPSVSKFQSSDKIRIYFRPLDVSDINEKNENESTTERINNTIKSYISDCSKLSRVPGPGTAIDATLAKLSYGSDIKLLASTSVNVDGIILGKVGYKPDLKIELYFYEVESMGDSILVKYVDEQYFNDKVFIDEERQKRNKIVNRILDKFFRKCIGESFRSCKKKSINYFKLIGTSVGGLSIITPYFDKGFKLAQPNNCIIFSGSRICEYYSYYETNRDPFSEAYPFTPSGSGESLSREELYREANRRYRNQQIAFLATGSAILIATFHKEIKSLLGFGKKNKSSTDLNETSFLLNESSSSESQSKLSLIPVPFMNNGTGGSALGMGLKLQF